MVDINRLNEYDKKRYLANKELIEILKGLIDMYPTQRFDQIMCNYGFENPTFYKEPWERLEHVKRILCERQARSVLIGDDDENTPDDE